MNRRGFIGGLGGLIATAALPGCRTDEPSVFSQRGNFERLALGYAHIKVGATAPFSLLHISDTHLTSVYDDESDVKQKLAKIRTQTFGGCQEEALRDSLAWAKTNVDFVVHTGDLIDFQSRANYDLVKKCFGTGAAKVASAGNHEFSPEMWMSAVKEEHTEDYKDLTRKDLQAAFPYDLQFNATVVNGVNFIAMDDVYGYVPPACVEKFHAEVKKGLPIVLCMHVPFYTDGIWRANTKFWTSSAQHGKPNFFRTAAVPDARGDYVAQQQDPVTREFIAYLKSEKLLKGILAGHLHITIQDRFSPTAMQYVVGGNFLFHGQEVLFT